MPKNNKPKKEASKTIVDTECNLKIRGKSLLVEYENVTYIAYKEFVEKLVNGKLTKQDGSTAKAIKLNILTEKDGIVEPKKDIFLTVKAKSFYIKINDDLLIAPLDNLQKLVTGEYTWVKMGLFE